MMHEARFRDALAVTDNERVVRLGLAALEGEMRDAALVGLAAFAESGLVAAELFPSLAGLRRPAWGTWNGLLIAMTQTRRAVLREGDQQRVHHLESAGPLLDLLRLLDQSIGPDVAEQMGPLAKLVNVKVTAKTAWRAALATAITLRNRVAHDQPTDPDWWAEAAAALRPYLQARLDHPLVGQVPRPAPWFESEEGQAFAFNGIDKDNAALYVAPGGRSIAVAENGGRVLQQLQRMLGRQAIQEDDFRRLLGKLAPADVRGVLMDDYLVGPPVGSGGYGTVHLGRQLSTNRQVAVKLLHDGATDDMKARFRQEAEFLVRLSNPHIVRAYDVGEATWRPPRAFSLDDEAWYRAFKKGSQVKQYLILEWVQGKTLDQVYAPGQRAADADELLGWFEQAAAALGAVHAAGLVHRDVKPSNLMVTDDGRMKLMDFGVARSQGEHRTLKTTTGRVLGTVAYMSPEQLRAADAESEIGPASDVYSLCATFYELFTGSRLFDHDTTDAHTVEMAKRNQHRPAPARSRVPDVSWEVSTMLAVGLDPEPAQRYADGAELHRDLAHALADEPLEKRPPSPWRRARLAYRRNRVVTNLVAGFVLAAIAGVGFYVASIAAEQKRTVRANEQLVAEQAQTVAERDEKERQRARAESELTRARRALSRVLEKQGQAALDNQVDGAVMYLVGAAEMLPDDDPKRRSLLERLASEAEGYMLPVSVASFEHDLFKIVFSPDGKRAVILDREWRLWHWELGGSIEPQIITQLEGYPRVLVWTPDGRSLLTFGHNDNALVRWDRDAWESDVVLETSQAIYDPVLSPDTALLAGSTVDSDQLVVIDTRNGRDVYRSKDGVAGPRPLGFDATGGYLLTAQLIDWDTPQALERWQRIDLESGQILKLLDQPKEDDNSGSLLALAPDAQWVAYVDPEGAPRLFRWPEWAEQALPVTDPQEGDTPDGRASAVKFSSTGSFLVVQYPGLQLKWSLDPVAFLGRRVGSYGYRNRSFGSLPDGRSVFLDTDEVVFGRWESEEFEEEDTRPPGRDFVAWHTPPAGSIAIGETGDNGLYAHDLAAVMRTSVGATHAALTEPGDGTDHVHAYSPSGAVLAIGDDRGVVRVWDTATGNLIHHAEAHPGGVRRLTISADGRTLATAGEDGALRIERLDEPEAPVHRGRGFPIDPRVYLEHDDSFGRGPDTAKPSGSGAYLVDADRSFSGETLVVIDRQTYRTVSKIESSAEDAVAAHLLHPTRDLVVTGTNKGLIRVWNLADATPVAPPFQIADSHRRHLSADADRIVILTPERLDILGWDGALMATHPIEPSVSGPTDDYLLIHEEGLAIAVTPQRALCVDLATGETVAETTLDALGHDEPTAAAYDPSQGRLLIATGREVESVALEPGAVSKAWGESEAWGELSSDPADGTSPIVAMARSEDGSWLLVYEGGELETRGPDGELTARGDGLPFLPLAAAAEGSDWKVRYADQRGRLHGDPIEPWVTYDAELNLKHRPLAHNTPVVHLALASDGEVLVSVSTDGTVRRWNTATGEEVAPPVIAEASCETVLVGPSAAWVALGYPEVDTGWTWSEPKLPHADLIDLLTGETRFTIEFPPDGADDWQTRSTLLDASPDGSVLLAATTRGQARAFHTADGSPIGPWVRASLQGSSGVEGVRLDESGRRALIWSDNDFRVFSLTDGTPLSPRVDRGAYGVTRMGFTPDGHGVFAVLRDRFQTWDIVTGEPATTWAKEQRDVDLLDMHLADDGWTAWQADAVWRSLPDIARPSLSHYKAFFEAATGHTLDETGTLNPLGADAVQARLQLVADTFDTPPASEPSP